MLKKAAYCALSIAIILTLSGCANQRQFATFEPTTQQEYISADAIQILHKRDLSHPYTVLGTVSADRYNVFGIKRQFASVHRILQQAAAQKGGDALISLRHTDQTVTAKVIKFENPQTA